VRPKEGKHHAKNKSDGCSSIHPMATYKSPRQSVPLNRLCAAV
jgi:hypothetical protein